MSDLTKEQQAILAVARHVQGLAAECGKSGHKLVDHVEEILGVAAPVEVAEPPPAPVAETVVSQHPLDSEPVAEAESKVES